MPRLARIRPHDRRPAWSDSAPPAPLQKGLTPVAETRPPPFHRLPTGKRPPGVRAAPPGAGWADVIRQHYDAAANEPVPPEFQNLMDAIARKIDDPDKA